MDAHGLYLNNHKPLLMQYFDNNKVVSYIVDLFEVPTFDLEDRFTYLGFKTKPNKYWINA